MSYSGPKGRGVIRASQAFDEFHVGLNEELYFVHSARKVRIIASTRKRQLAIQFAGSVLFWISLCYLCALCVSVVSEK
jgi:hypothetical protein